MILFLSISGYWFLFSERSVDKHEMFPEALQINEKPDKEPISSSAYNHTQRDPDELDIRFCNKGEVCVTSDSFISGREEHTFENFDIETILALPVMSLGEEERLNDYWHGLLISNPEEIWNLLDSYPLLLKTFSHNNMRLLFSVFSYDLLYSHILSVQNLNYLPSEHQSHIIELMLELDSNFSSYEVFNWSNENEVRTTAMLQVVESWKNQGSTGVDFMNFVYELRDEQLNQLMSESFYSYGFTDVEQQLDWIATYDVDGIFSDNVPHLLEKLSQSLTLEDFIEYSHTSPFSIQAREIIQNLE